MRKFSLYVLTFGTFGLGMAEFGMMSILSVAATGLQVSVPEAGHFISAYALGVCFGAIVLTFLALPGVLLTVLGLSRIYYFSRLYEKENTVNIG